MQWPSFFDSDNLVEFKEDATPCLNRYIKNTTVQKFISKNGIAIYTFNSEEEDIERAAGDFECYIVNPDGEEKPVFYSDYLESKYSYKLGLSASGEVECYGELADYDDIKYEIGIPTSLYYYHVGNSGYIYLPNEYLFKGGIIIEGDIEDIENLCHYLR